MNAVASNGIQTAHTLASWLPALWLQATGGGLLGGFGGLPILLLFFVAMYFLMIAPNQKKQKQWQAMLSALKSGDRVTTMGGIRGVVLQVKDDSVLVRVAPDNLKLEFVKSAISAVTTDEDTKTK
jgi:preprotein translocase subunit YajC